MANLSGAHELLLLLQELPVKQGNSLPVAVGQSIHGGLVGLVQALHETTLTLHMLTFQLFFPHPGHSNIQLFKG